MMGVFDRLFHRQPSLVEDKTEEQPISTTESLKWEELPGYIPTDPKEYQEVSLITAAIAAGDALASSFEIKRIMKRNPEVELVSLIAAVMAAGQYPESHFRVKSIKKRVL
jgi:hypothetical protein